MSTIKVNVNDVNAEKVIIKECDYSKVENIYKEVESLNEHRREVGRLYQTINSLVNATTGIEENLRDIKSKLIASYGITEGQWVIDFAEKSLIKLDKDSPVIP